MCNDKMLHQMCYHEKSKTWFRVTKHGEYLTHVQKIKLGLFDETEILPVHALLHTKDLKFYPWKVGGN
ncbi:hypothetical protein Phab24_id086 [Acinetobacter phage Phab24]|nr:hypothetical protein Phab24_id086 [Acinetobacter phage Phab24]